MTAGRAYGTALVLLAAGAVVAIVGYGLTWATAEVPLLAGAAQAVRPVSLTGRDLIPGAAAAAWIGLAAVAGVVATRAWGRVAVSALALLAGLAVLAGAVVFAVDPIAVVDSAVRDQAPDGAVGLDATLAWLVPLAGGLLVVAGAGWATARGRGWPTLGSRYERAGRTPRQPTAWEAQDLGRDPTDDLVE